MPRRSSQRNEELYSRTKQLHVNVYGSFICNIPKLETARMFLTDERLSNLGNPHTVDHHRAIKRNRLSIHTTWESPRRSCGVKKANPKRLYAV